MAVNAGPDIIEDGLVLCLDAGNRRSYSGSGTTWFDLSGRGNNGTLTNGPTYSSANNGAFDFDGSDDYVLFSSIPVRTICFWGKMDPSITSLAGLVGGPFGDDYSLRTEGGSFRSTAPNAPNVNDFHFGFTAQFMINGISNLSTNASGYYIIPDGRTLQQDFYVGAIGNTLNADALALTFPGRIYRGTIYAVYLYDRQLSNEELLQNFNALRGRFGL